MEGLLIEAAMCQAESPDLLARVIKAKGRCCLPVDGNIMICEMIAVIDHWDRHRYGTMVDLKDFFQSITDAELARAVGEVVKAAAKKANMRRSSSAMVSMLFKAGMVWVPVLSLVICLRHASWQTHKQPQRKKSADKELRGVGAMQASECDLLALIACAMGNASVRTLV
jgi:hypothetical protein